MNFSFNKVRKTWSIYLIFNRLIILKKGLLKSKSKDSLKLSFIDTRQIWPVESAYPDEKSVFEYNRMIFTILTELFPKNSKSKPKVLVHSKLVILS